MHDFVYSQIRTVIPKVVALLVGLFGIPDSYSAEMTLALSLIAGYAYYFAARLLGRWFPWAERLLGIPKPPTY